MRKRILFVLISLVFVSQTLWAQNAKPPVKPAATPTAAPAATPTAGPAAPTAPAAGAKEKRPIIFIPGVLGSRLINGDTGENVWVNIRRSKDDDMRLPMSANLTANRDKLIANQVLDKIKIIKYFPKISVYQGVVDFFQTAGYKRGDWENPHLDGAPGDHDTYYLFAYDWRRDNVESAAKLLQQIEQLRRKLGKPTLKFDIMAHSMGGLVARYAAMYGRADLTDNPRPNWEGTKYFHDICLFGVPNDGAMEAFDTMLNGYTFATFAGRRHLGVLSSEVALSAPALFELLPHGDSLNFYDEELQPVKLDIYDPATWKTYGWSAAFDERFRSTLSKTALAQMDNYFTAVLGRAKKFHNALAVKSPPPPSLYFFTYGSNCKRTLDGAVVYKEKDSSAWKTLTRGDSFRNSRGEKIDDKEVKKILYTDGDGTVTNSSLMVDSLYTAEKGAKPIGNAAAVFFACEDHASLLSNKIIQDSVLEQLLRD